MDAGITNHRLVGTGKLIHDWEPVTPYIIDKVAEIISSEILKMTEKRV